MKNGERGREKRKGKALEEEGNGRKEEIGTYNGITRKGKSKGREEGRSRRRNRCENWQVKDSKEDYDETARKGREERQNRENKGKEWGSERSRRRKKCE